MGLAVRIIPTLLCRGRQLVKGQRFNSWRSVGVAAQAVRIHQARGVDELVLLDIGATPEGRGPDLSLIEELSETCFMPLTVGGGVRSVKDVRALLNAGADKVAVCTASFFPTKDNSYKDGIRPFGRLSMLADAVGSQAIVAALDVKGGHPTSNCGAQLFPVPNDIRWWAYSLQRAGAGEIILTSIDREGTMEGYDLDLIRDVSKAVSIPVIAHGGCSSYEDMYQAIQAGASAVAAGALFQFTDATPKGAAAYLKSKGVEVRL